MGGCCIRNPHTEKVREDGLIAGHAYSILREKTVTYKDKPVHLVELRNPWGVRDHLSYPRINAREYTHLNILEYQHSNTNTGTRMER